MIKIPSAYELIRKERIDEIGADAYVVRHRKSQAHLILMDADDTNKVFNITFRTPPADDTGVPHILEHSVLCGSRKYPCKDPFVELAKGSLNTFLNAMTYPEKTMYPVASYNDKDFRNLMDVYMDAVFRPNIYRNERIFRQEGWHYEMETPESDLTVNGVVYNEMKGAFSDPESVLERFNKEVLFKDTPYAFESGGDPASIPELGYDEFLAFHGRYYHPSNSYIYLFGKMDYEERLNYLDSEYLSEYEAIDPDSAIPEQAPYGAMAHKALTYGISEGEDEEEAIFSWSKVVGGLMDPVESLAFEVLGYALLNAPGAPIKKALLENGLGVDIYGGYDSSYLQPIFNVTAKGAEKEKAAEFEAVIDRVLKETKACGIPKKTLLAGINNIEFSMREADFGRYPKGLIYGLQIFETWIHDEEKAFVHLKFNKTFEKIKALVETDYFEKLIDEKLIANSYGAVITATPEKGLTAENDRRFEEKLAALKASLSEEEIRAIVRETAALKEYQETPSTEEELRTLPLLSISDIRKQVEPFKNEEREIGGMKAVYHDILTSGIGYLAMYLPVDNVPVADFPYLALLKNFYTLLDTEHYGYRELGDEIGLYTGGFGAEVSTISDLNRFQTVRPYFVLRGKTLYGNTADMIRLFTEVFTGTRFEDTARMKEIIGEIRMEMQNGMVNSGHSTALKRVLSYSSVNAKQDDLLGGVSFYRFLEELEKNFDARKDALCEKLRELEKKIFLTDGAVISYTGEEEGYRALAEELPKFTAYFGKGERGKADQHIDLQTLNEGFKCSSQVQYVAAGGNFKKHGHEYKGSMRVLKTLLGYEYLWIRLRVKGGAYGCMSYFNRDGEMAFVSFRDPNLAETLEVYEDIPEYLRTLTIDERDMTKYIIGTISESDTPLQPGARGVRSFMAWMMGITREQLQKERDEVLNCTAEDLRALAAPVESVLSDRQFCAVGGEEKIEENKELFTEVKQLTGE